MYASPGPSGGAAPNAAARGSRSTSTERPTPFRPAGEEHANADDPGRGEHRTCSGRVLCPPKAVVELRSARCRLSFKNVALYDKGDIPDLGFSLSDIETEHSCR